MGASYLIGSVPFGVVIAKAKGLPDPRTIGSGNIGATNMLRTGNKKLALLTLLLDGGKGALAVAVAAWIFFHHHLGGEGFGYWDATWWARIEEHYTFLSLAVLLSTIGHIYSPWLKFKGGKGVATTFGAMLMLSFPVGIALIALWLLTFAATRISSLSSIAALAFLPLLANMKLGAASALILSITAGIVIYKHATNISRLIKGDEPKFTSKP